MAKFETMASLAAAHPMMGADKPFAIYHRAFCYWCSQLNGNEYVCWAAIH